MKFFVTFVLLPALFAAEHSGTVKFARQAVPGVTVTLTRGTQTHRAITDAQGRYRFENLPDGSTWTAKVEMQLFSPETKEIAVPSAPIDWDLKALPVETLGPLTKATQPFERTQATVSQTAKKAVVERQQASEDLAMKAADGFLVNGTVNNGASSPFALLPAFGNNRRGQRSLYNGNLGLILNNSNFDARN
jgi:hypothetical protein